MEKFLNFLIHHNTTIIEVLFAITLLFISYAAIRFFLFGPEESGATGATDLSKLEISIKEIIEKAGSVTSSAGSSEEAQKLATEISALRSELEAKKKEIEEMKESVGTAAAAPALSNEEKGALEAKLKELEAKLAEYEIISEDIADLSFYKEQNIKLQKEIESLKSTGGAAGGAMANATVAAPSPSAEASAGETPAGPSAVNVVPSPVAPAEEPQIVGKAPSTDAENQTFEAPVVEPSASSSAAVQSVDDDLMAEFAAAVAKQKSEKEGEEESAPPSAPPQAPAPKAEAPAAVASDIAGNEAKESSPADVDLGQVDMDKMLAESAEIQSNAAASEVSIDEALGSSMDENKLLQEAAAMNTVTSEDQKLMGDFENFVKKGEGS